MDSEEDTSCCCCCTGNGNKNRGHRRKAKKGRFCSCFGDSNPPREFEDEIYSEICSNNHSGKGQFFGFKKFKERPLNVNCWKGQKRPKSLKKGHFGDSNPQENLKMKFTLKYVSIDFLGIIFFSSELIDSDSKWIRQKFKKCIFKSSRFFFIFTCILPDYVFHERSKESWKNSHLKTCEMVSLGGGKTYFGEIALKWWIFRHEKKCFWLILYHSFWSS